MPITQKNKVKYGLKNVHYAVRTVAEDGSVTFGTPVRIPGAVSMNLPPQGEVTKFYADDVAYFVSEQNDGYQGDLEVALIPDSFAKDVLGETEDETDKVMVENANAHGSTFALLFEFDGDVKATRHVLYNCSVGRPAIGSSTRTNVKEPKTSSMTITSSPEADGLVKAKTKEETPAAIYNGWYSEVWLPKVAAPTDG